MGGVDFDVIGSEIEKARKRRKASYNSMTGVIEQLRKKIKSAKDGLRKNKRIELQSGNKDVKEREEDMSVDSPVKELIMSLSRDVKSLSNSVESVGNEHKNYYNVVSKLCKSVDKLFDPKFERICRPIDFDTSKADEIVYDHLYRRSYYRSGAKFIEESGVNITVDKYKPLFSLHEVIEALKRKDLTAAVRWTREKSIALQDIGSSLDLQLTRLEFLQILEDPSQSRINALEFARGQFERFTETNMKDVQQMMGCLLWKDNLKESPYEDFMSDELYAAACTSVQVDGCRINGMPRESMLSVSFRAGILAIPTLIKMATIIQNSSKDWNTMTHLPVEIPLHKSLQFHSIFSCPVSREESTSDNPPILLLCGHVILKSSMKRLLKNKMRFKCPTCPVEQTEEETRELFL